MELPETLVKAIESTHVAYQGLSHPLRLASVRPDADTPESAIITVETVHDGTTYRAQCRLPLQGLNDAPRVVEALAAAMRHALTGETEPGTISGHQ